MKKIQGGILAAKGFMAGAARAGIKDGGGLDVGLVWSQHPAATAAIFTQSSVSAAPVQLSRQHIQDHQVRAVVVNSDNANCMTGREGKQHAKQMAETAAGLLNLKSEEVLVASTGIIGKPLPIDKVNTGIAAAFDNRSSASAADDFSTAIMTTDTHPKAVAYECEIGGQTVVIGGCAKGSGMMQPNMATMLSFLTSDVAITPELLDQALREVARTTFNSITVDGETSTNDTLALMANGQAANAEITGENEDYKTFVETLWQVCQELALMIVRDGEGATVLVTVQVNGAADYSQAKTIAYTVANSPLVKTAAHGKTGNWGRIAQAVGMLGLPITEDSLKIDVTNPAADELTITIGLKLGDATATVYTCDFSKDYVDINVEYN
jgi:glutamate N-acetyltransferase/amino-acid N-acetyltransferase